VSYGRSQVKETVLTRLGGGAARVVAFVYLAGLAVSMLIFNYQYAREHGFMDWLVLGEVVPSLKSTIWPYYLVRGLVEPRSTPARLSDTREGLHTTDIPRLYPVLIDHLRQRSTLGVRWITRTNEEQSLQVSLASENSIVITTTIPISESPDGAPPFRRLTVVMTDDGCDGNLDRIVFVGADGTSESRDPDELPAYRILWDQCLGITFLYGEPFKQGSVPPN
jgi:hypothetical protein